MHRPILLSPFAAAALSIAAATSACGAQAATPPGGPAPLDTPSAEVGVRATLSAYQHALNTADIDAVPGLYTDDGVFMAPYSASAIGRAAVRGAYVSVFKHIAFDVTFDVAELVQVAPDWAFARTNSAGVSTDPSTGARSREANQELFIFRRVGGAWKIARYSFSPVTPPKP